MARRLRRGRGAASFSGWRRRIAAAALGTAAITALIAFAIPSPLTIGFFIFPAADSSGGDRFPPPPPPPLLHPLPRRAASALASILANSTSRSSASSPPPIPPPPIGNSGSSKANSSVGDRTKVTRTRQQVAYWRMSPDEALANAKKEIENAPLVVDDPDLYAPLFRNVSAFKRMVERQFSTRRTLKEFTPPKDGF